MADFRTGAGNIQGETGPSCIIFSKTPNAMPMLEVRGGGAGGVAEPGGRPDATKALLFSHTSAPLRGHKK